MNDIWPSGEEWESLKRIFGSFDAYRKSLPERKWIDIGGRWKSIERTGREIPGEHWQ